MTATDAHTMERYDRHVSRAIADRHAYDELTALRLFMGSETYRMLADDDLKLWHFGPAAVFDLWEAERATGDPRNSPYLRA
ncbi:MAG: hypothetical protein LBK42_07135 [Propionibacteriaceae bacterium]|jgi:hypothetical protein|nr:hypothetical protein [Propionibacteriaceae bacterium]